jgi:hypothetical protein
MANLYVWSGATGTGTGANFTNAYTTLSAANAAGAAGDRYIVASDHQENLTAALTFNGTISAPDQVICINRTTSLPQRMVDNGGYIGTAGTTGFELYGFVQTHGVNMRPGGGSATTNLPFIGLGILGNMQRHFNTNMDLPNNAGMAIQLGAAGPGIFEFYGLVINNGTGAVLLLPVSGSLVKIADTAQVLNTTLTGTLLSGASNGVYEFQGVGLLNVSSGALFATAAFARSSVVFESCGIHTGLDVAAKSQLQRAELINCVDQSGNIRHETWQHGGNLTRNTAIFRTGGANDSIAPFSWRVITNANLEVERPFETFDVTFSVPLAKVGVSTTVNVHLVTDNVTLTNAECSLHVGAAVTASSTIHTFYDTAAAPLATPANLPTSSEAWTTTGLTTPVYQRMQVTFTPTRKGPHRLQVQVRKPSTTLYICPNPVIA